MTVHKVAIIGTGPAGLTAALYSARADLAPIVFEGHEPGGQLTLTTDVENFPGFPEGVMGPDLINNIKKQAARFGAEYIQKHVTRVDTTSRPFKFYCDDEEFQSETLIISTGASAKFLGLANEKELTGKGVSTCATCDGFFYRDKVVHIVGGGDTAMEDATFIAKFASKVYMCVRKDTLRASKPMQKRAMDNEKIEFLWNTEVQEILFDDSGVTGIKVINNKSNEVSTRQTDGLFYAIGHRPNTAFLEKQIDLDDHGFISTKNGGETNIAGIFACGDVQDPIFRQAISAAGSGCQASMLAERFLHS